LTILLWLVTASATAAPSPNDLAWLRRECGDGALAYQSQGRIYLTEISTGKTEHVGSGAMPEFSPDSSKLAWIDGDRAVGRMRKGDGTLHVIAEGVAPTGGVHWISNDEVVVLRQDRKWYRIKLTGEEREVPELTAMGRVQRETDVKLGDDGVWSMATGRSWRTSDGRSGTVKGNCSVSLSPDGRSVTSLQSGHVLADLERIRPNGINKRIRWPYDTQGSKGFDNHRWSSNDARFIVVQDEVSDHMVVLHHEKNRGTRVGEKGSGELYGDFTVGDGKGAPWPGKSQTVTASKPAESWPADHTDVHFVWQHATASNTIAVEGAATPHVCRVEPTGLAMIGPHHAMDLSRGGGFAVDADSVAVLAKSLAEAAALSVELVITPRSLDQRAQRSVVMLADARGQPLVQLAEQRGTLTLRVASIGNLPMGKLEGTGPHHVLITVHRDTPAASAHVQAMLNGRGVLVRTPRSSSIRSLALSRVVFGTFDRTQGWDGRIEHVAIYGRAVGEAEAASAHALLNTRFEARNAPARAIIEGRLTAVSKVPDRGNYPDAMLVYEYAVERVVEGKFTDKTARVAHHGIINGQVINDVADRKAGTTHRLVLEAFDDHPQLASLKMSDAGEEAALDAALWYAVQE
jgi:hypothetical protein